MVADEADARRPRRRRRRRRRVEARRRGGGGEARTEVGEDKVARLAETLPQG